MTCWGTVKLEEIATVSGVSARNETDLPVYSVTKHRGFVPSLEYFNKQVFSRELGTYTVVEPGEFAYATIHLDEGSVGVCPVRCLISPMYTAFRVTSAQVHPTFLIRYLKSRRALAEYPRLGKGSVERRRAISFERLGKIEIPLPPLAEQRRIAEILDRAEALRAKRLAALAQLDILTQSIFGELFGDIVKNPRGWPIRSLGEVVRGKPNNGIFRRNPDYLQDGTDGLPVVWVEELFRGSHIETKESRRVRPTSAELTNYGLKHGDILFCRSSLKLDGIAFNNVYLGPDNGALFECHLIRVQPELSIISPIYLNCLLRLPQMRAIAKSKSKTATMTTIDQTSLCSIPVMLPPLALQQEFERHVAAVATMKCKYDISLARMDALFAALQFLAFRGGL